MNYKVIYANKNTKEIEKTVLLQAENIRKARETANSAENLPQGCFCKVYNILDTDTAFTEAALQIVRRATKYMIDNYYTDLSYRLYNGCRVQTIVDSDVLDCIQVVSLSLWENRKEETETAHRIAYNSLYRYLRSEKSIDNKDKNLYIEDIDGDIINVSKNINTIVKECDNLPLITDSIEEKEKAEKLQAIIVDILQDCTPTQKRVIKLIAQALSERQVADVMNRAQPTIHQHKIYVEKKARAKYPNGFNLGKISE